jgi:hypothetical protein
VGTVDFEVICGRSGVGYSIKGGGAPQSSFYAIDLIGCGLFLELF